MNKNTLFCKETASPLPPPLACQGGLRMATCPVAALRGHLPTQTASHREGFISVAYNTISVQSPPPAPTNTRLLPFK